MKRKRFSEEQIVGILREGEEEGKSILEVCRAHGIADHTYYRWRRKYGGMQVSELQRAKELEQENARLKRLVVQRDLEIDRLKELVSKKW